jgi:hypothetical protein
VARYRGISRRSGPVGLAVEGATELAREFRAAGRDSKELSAAYRAIAKELVPPARREAPRRTGALAGATRGSGTKTSAILSAGSKRVPYGGVIHYGNPSRKTYPAGVNRQTAGIRSTGTLGVIRPNPWLYEVVDSRRDEVLEAFEANVGEVLRRHDLTP